MVRETNTSPHHITSLPSSHHVTPRTQPLIFDLLTVQFPSHPDGSFLPQCVMSAWASHPHSRVHAACRAGSKLQAEMSREDDQHWERVSTSAQSEAPADARCSKSAPEQGSSAHEEIPVAGSRSKEEWEQPSLTLVGPGNVAVKKEGSCNTHRDKRRDDERKWECVIPTRRRQQGGKLFCPAVLTAVLSTGSRPARGVEAVQIRRLRWWQSILMDREGKKAMKLSCASSLADWEWKLKDHSWINGTLSPNAHPWALQLEVDLLSLKDIEPGRESLAGEHEQAGYG